MERCSVCGAAVDSVFEHAADSAQRHLRLVVDLGRGVVAATPGTAGTDGPTRAELDAKDAEVQALQSQLHRMGQQNASMSQVICDLSERADAMQEEMELMRARLQAAQSELELEQKRSATLQKHVGMPRLGNALA
eukprot:m51a1_g5488 hypothetical protein (135) ;mRNA; r:323088-323492